MSSKYSSSPISEDDDAEFRRFEKIFDDAKAKLVKALRDKKSEVANSSSEQLKSLKRQLLNFEINISKLTQENSQLREEKRRSDLSLKLSEDTSADLQRKFQDEKKRREEIELALQDKTTVIQSLRLQLYEKETEILRLSQNPNYPTQTDVKSIPENSLRQTATSSSLSSQYEQLSESEEAVSTSNPEPTRARGHNFHQVNKTTMPVLTKSMSMPSSMYNPECPTDLEEDRDQTSHWNSPVSQTRIKTEPIDHQMEYVPPHPHPHPHPHRNGHEMASTSKAPQPTPSPPTSSSASGGRFEMSAKRSLLRPSYIEDKNKDVKRMRRESGHSSCSSASGSSRSSISKTSALSSSALATSRISVVDIPERLRLNYGFITNWDLDHCPHARQFWCDNSNINSIKYFIRFYDDDSHQCKDPLNTKRLCVKEQVGLQEPTVYNIKLKDIVRKLEGHLKGQDGGRNSEGNGDGNFQLSMSIIRLWIDVRDFDVFLTDVSGFFYKFGQFISHFTFGRRLYSFKELRPSLILNFIFKALPNLEYFGINDGMLKSMDHDVKNFPSNLLPKLKVIRLISVTSRFSSPFITELLIRAPALTHLYGLPLHCLSELELYFETMGKKNVPPWIISPNSSNSDCYISMDCVKSVNRTRFDANSNTNTNTNAHVNSLANGQDSKKYLIDLTTLSRLHPPLEVLDVRTFFVRCVETRRQCVRKWAELIQANAGNVQTLTVEPIPADIYNTSSNLNPLVFPRLENCETLHFDMNSHIDSGMGYFPLASFDWSYSFPSLKTVQVSLDEKSSNALGKSESKVTELFDLHFPQEVFRPCDALKRIEKLSLIEFAPYCLIGKFHGLFQRITILSLKMSLIEMSKVLPRVFKFWPGLKQLSLEIGFCSHMDFNLDSAFTGIHFTQCRVIQERLTSGGKLEQQPEVEVQKEINKSQREIPISNLKELTVLKMVLNHKGKVEFEPSDCLFTPVAAIYGFGRERMPNLRTVVIGFDDRMTSYDKRCMMKVLQPMKPFLTIDY